MSENKSKKETVKQIIRELHKGLSVSEAKERLVKEIGSITSVEIAQIEQSLISEGMPADEIKKFCNVHALLFESNLENTVKDPNSPTHPVVLFKSENREIEKSLNLIKEGENQHLNKDFAVFKKEFKEKLQHLQGIKIHYQRKENVLFPYLEKQGFTGPSKVMWGKDKEVLDLIKSALQELDTLSAKESFKKYFDEKITPLIEEANGMIFKEENVLYPTALEMLSAQDWAHILKESNDIGYVYIKVPEEVALLSSVDDSKKGVESGVLNLPTGKLEIDELVAMLNVLPVDITFIDKDDTVKYFSDNKERIFPRTASIIGRKVQNCHPPKSVQVVNDIVDAFKTGKKDSVSFWIKMQGKFLYIRYFAVRSKGNAYLGTLEVSQEITDIKNLEGERRLVDEKN